jgi:hypothetical protein
VLSRGLYFFRTPHLSLRRKTKTQKHESAMNSKYLKPLKRWMPSGILFVLFAMNSLGLVAADTPTNAPPSTARATNAATPTSTWLSFAFPTQTLYLKQDSELRVTRPENQAARN